MNEWPVRKRNSTKVRVDPSILDWLKIEYPSVQNPERLRRIKERIIKSESLVEKLLKVKRKI